MQDLTAEIKSISLTPVFKGRHFDVFRGKYDGSTVAIKVLRSVSGATPKMKQRAIHELPVWRELGHPNICSLLGYAVDRMRFGEYGALISPWHQYHDVGQFVQTYGSSLSMLWRTELWRGVVAGIAYLHNQTPIIVHGDLKPGNILIDDYGRPRICDFGLSGILQSYGLDIRTPDIAINRYLAPELLFPESEHETLPTMTSDVYALGCVGLELLFLQIPYATDRGNNVQLKDPGNIQDSSPVAPRPETLSEEANVLWDILEACWCRDPVRRMHTKRILELSVHKQDVTNHVSIINSQALFEGAYSNIFQGRYQGETVAVKVLRPLELPLHQMIQRVSHEREVLAGLKHPNIISLYGYTQSSDNFGPFGALVFPWQKHGNAKKYLCDHGSDLSMSQRTRLWQDVVKAVSYLHSRDPVIIHGDLKPTNILVDDVGTAKLCDFGLVRIAGKEDLHTSGPVGTDRYLAPELLSQPFGQPSIASDVFALGCIGLEFLFDEGPEASMQHNRYTRLPVSKERSNPPAVRPTKVTPYEDQLWNILDSSWRSEPAARATAVEVMKQLDELSIVQGPESGNSAKLSINSLDIISTLNGLEYKFHESSSLRHGHNSDHKKAVSQRLRSGVKEESKKGSILQLAKASLNVLGVPHSTKSGDSSLQRFANSNSTIRRTQTNKSKVSTATSHIGGSHSTQSGSMLFKNSGPLTSGEDEDNSYNSLTSTKPDFDPNVAILSGIRPNSVDDLTGRVTYSSPQASFEGAYSNIWKGMLDKTQPVAIKCLKGQKIRPEKAQRRYRREVGTWWCLRHENVVPLLGLVYDSDDRSGNAGSMVSPWYKNGSAVAYLSNPEKFVSIAERVDIFHGVAKGIVYLHNFDTTRNIEKSAMGSEQERGIEVIHGDLKPANILIDDDGTPKLCDFGLFRLIHDSAPTGVTTTSLHTGTRRYLSYEQVTEDGNPTTASDVHALACVGMEVLYDHLPYANVISPPMLDYKITRAIERQEPPATRPEGISGTVVSSLWDVFELSWSPEPDSRPTSHAVCDFLRRNRDRLVATLEKHGPPL